VVGRVDLGVDLPAARTGDDAGLGARVVRRVDGVVEGTVCAGHDAAVAGGGVEPHDLVVAVGARGDAGDAGAVRGQGRGPLRPRARGVGQFAGGGVEDAQAQAAPAVEDGDRAVVQRREPALADAPQGVGELLLPGAEGRGLAGGGVDAVEVPPAGAVGDGQEGAVRRPLGLGDGLVRSARERAYAGEGPVGGGVRDLQLGAVPGHPGVIPGQPDGVAAVRGEPGRGDEAVPVAVEFADGAGAVKGHGDGQPAYVGGGRAGELLHDAPHLAAVRVRVGPRVGEAQSAAHGRDRGERARLGPAGGVGLDGVEALVAEVGEDDERAVFVRWARARHARPGLAAVLDDAAADVPRRRQHRGGPGVAGAQPQQGAPAALGRAGGGPPQFLADRAEVFRSAVARGDERGVDGRGPAAVRGTARGTVHVTGPAGRG
jgi:hypothetical protein